MLKLRVCVLGNSKLRINKKLRTKISFCYHIRNKFKFQVHKLARLAERSQCNSEIEGDFLFPSLATVFFFSHLLKDSIPPNQC